MPLKSRLILACMLLGFISAHFATTAANSPPLLDAANTGKQHQQDVQLLKAWWYELRRPLPAEALTRLRVWLAKHPSDAETQFLLAQAGAEAETRKPRSARTREWLHLLKAAADAGYSPAVARLGLLTVLGDGLPRDPARGLQLIRNALKSDDPDAHLAMGVVLLLGLSDEGKDLQQAQRELTRAAAAGVVRAWFFLAEVCEQGGRPDEAIANLKQGAELGDPQAQIFLHKRYAEGSLVPRNLREAERWGKLAAESGNPEYQRGLGEFYKNYFQGPDGTQKAIQWFKVAEQGGDAKATYWLGNAQMNGAEMPMDVDQGLARLHRAADEGVPEAQLSLGQFYLNGLFVDRNPQRARDYFAQAALQGSSDAAIFVKWLDESDRRARQKTRSPPKFEY